MRFEAFEGGCSRYQQKSSIGSSRGVSGRRSRTPRDFDICVQTPSGTSIIDACEGVSDESVSDHHSSFLKKMKAFVSSWVDYKQGRLGAFRDLDRLRPGTLARAFERPQGRLSLTGSTHLQRERLSHSFFLCWVFFFLCLFSSFFINNYIYIYNRPSCSS